MSAATDSNGFVRFAYPDISTGFSGVIFTLAMPTFHSGSAANTTPPLTNIAHARTASVLRKFEIMAKPIK
jgi:hypothetical protein